MKSKPECSKCGDHGHYPHGYCPACRKEYSAEYYQRNKVRLRAAEQSRRDRDRTAHNARKRQRSRLAKREAVDAYGGKCDCCGEARIEFLSIDHINGKGRLH